MNPRIFAAALCAAALLTLTACGSDSGQGTAERAPKTAAENTKSSNKEQPAEEEQPDTELKIGDGFRYKDGVKVTVTKISKITEYGQYDERPAANKTPFRVHWTITNGTSKPLSVDSWGYNATGATTGGESEIIAVEPGSKMMTGRLAAGRSGSFTAEYALAKSDGTEVVFTMTRMDESVNLLSEDPHWTGTIQ